MEIKKKRLLLHPLSETDTKLKENQDKKFFKQDIELSARGERA